MTRRHRCRRCVATRDADDRPVLGATVELLEVPAGAVHLRDADLGEHLVGLQRGFEESLEEVACGDLAGTVRALGDVGRAERQRGRGKVGGRIAVGDGSADRAAVAHLRIADLTGCIGEQRNVLGEHRTVLEIHVAGERADGDVVTGIADVRQFTDAADVDEHARLGESQLHQGQQAVPAGEELGIVAVLADELDGLFGGSGTDVVERCGDHDVAPAAQASTACTMLCIQQRTGFLRAEAHLALAGFGFSFNRLVAAMTMPGVQYPRKPWFSMNACCIGCISPLVARPSMVVSSLPSACTARIVQLFTASPSKCKVHAPHDEVSQPTLVPVRPSVSRT